MLVNEARQLPDGPSAQTSTGMRYSWTNDQVVDVVSALNLDRSYSGLLSIKPSLERLLTEPPAAGDAMTDVTEKT